MGAEWRPNRCAGMHEFERHNRLVATRILRKEQWKFVNETPLRLGRVIGSLVDLLGQVGQFDPVVEVEEFDLLLLRPQVIRKEKRQFELQRWDSCADVLQGVLVYIGLDERDKALHRLDNAHQEQEHSTWMLHLKVDPRLDPLRPDPRFQDLLRRVGLPP